MQSCLSVNKRSHALLPRLASPHWQYTEWCRRNPSPPIHTIANGQRIANISCRLSRYSPLSQQEWLSVVSMYKQS